MHRVTSVGLDVVDGEAQRVVPVVVVVVLLCRQGHLFHLHPLRCPLVDWRVWPGLPGSWAVLP
ncbi:hypothetical protein, partial [Pseudomonas syringae group genomosp. 3]|uniref:hypothetical protein n=1 Tax=Pseudomonas syringae group genomosp. 3 TaxID=251701 RepID=UPI001C80AE32